MSQYTVHFASEISPHWKELNLLQGLYLSFLIFMLVLQLLLQNILPYFPSHLSFKYCCVVEMPGSCEFTLLLLWAVLATLELVSGIPDFITVFGCWKQFLQSIHLQAGRFGDQMGTSSEWLCTVFIHLKEELCLN